MGFASPFKGMVDRMLGIHTRTVFGQKLFYIRARDGAKFDFYGVFNNSFAEVDPETETVVSVQKPHVGFRVRDLPCTPEQGDRILVRSLKSLYEITQTDPDSEGHQVLWLKKFDDE